MQYYFYIRKKLEQHFANKPALAFVSIKKREVMTDVNKEKLAMVFSGTLWQAELIKGLLDSNDIPCAIMDETISAVTSSYAGLDGAVLVVVNEDNKARALEIIENRQT